MNDKYLQIKKLLVMILFLNLAVSAGKIIYGYFIRSISMTADGFHSLADSTSNIIGIIGTYIASKPEDKGHPYGHKKFETFYYFSYCPSSFLVLINLMRSIADRLIKPVMPSVDTVSFIVMLITLAINIWVVYYETKKGRELMSDFLISDAVHTKSDILVSISVIGSLVGVKLGLPSLDIIIAIVISILIAKSAFEILKESASILCDAVAIDEAQISDIVMENDKVLSCHKIRSRGRKDDIHIDLHVHVHRSMTVDESHSLSHSIENSIRSRIEE